MPPGKIGSMNRRLWAFVACVAWIAVAAAADFPTKPLKLIVPFPPGGLLDNVGRALAPSLSAQLGQPVVVENRPGAAGMIGADAAVKAAPDGHTFLFSGGVGFVVAPLLNPGLAFDPLKDLAPVSMVTRGPSVLVAAPSFEARSVAELIALAKAAPGKLSYGTPGNGNPNHVAGELFKSAAGIDLVHVPYKGAAFVITDVIAGHVPVGFVTLGAAMPHLRSGKLKALAVTTAQRWEAAPELPTMGDAGLPQVQLVDWTGFFVPARTPKAAVERLNEVVQRSLAAPELRARLREQGLEAQGSTSAELAAELRSDVARLGRVAKEAGIRAD
jgi:tripartite-type tricarboxylate transporter receptor subunit TctC